MAGVRIFLFLLAGLSACHAVPPSSECRQQRVTLLPHERDCNKFYICDGFRWHTMSCGVGTAFNPLLHICDWPQNVKCPSPPANEGCRGAPCKNGGICVESGTSYTCRCSTDYTGLNCETYIPYSEGECRAGDKQTIEGGDCKTYRYCDRGNWRNYRCPRDHVFNAARNGCVPQLLFPCTNGVSDDRTTPQGFCDSNEQDRPDNTDCAKFYSCRRNSWQNYRCHDRVPVFNTSTRTCDYIYNANCGSRPTICKTSTRLPGNNIECKQFYECSNNRWILYNCPRDYRYDNATKRCLPRSQATCPTDPTSSQSCFPNPCRNGGTCSIINGRYSCRCVNGYSGRSCESRGDVCNCQNGGTCTNINGAQACRCRFGYEGNNCEIVVVSDSTPPSGYCNGNERNRPDSTDCRKFYSCQRNTWQKYKCHVDVPIYNTSTGLCDYVYNANCGSRPVVCINTVRVPGNHSDCRQFYECSGSRWVLYNCPRGYRYDASSKRCLRSTEVRCPAGPSTGSCFPNPCRNGGTCRNVGNGFSCQCVNGYSGTTCQSRGPYGVWSEWTESTTPAGACSKVCGGGQQFYTRRRRCIPRNGGTTCLGDSTDAISRSCNVEKCPCADNPCSGYQCIDKSTTDYDCVCPSFSTGLQYTTGCFYPCPPGASMIYPDITDRSNFILCYNETIAVTRCPNCRTYSFKDNNCV